MTDGLEPYRPRPFSNPETMAALQKQMSPFSNPETMAALQKRMSPFSNPETMAALQKQMSPFSSDELKSALAGAFTAFRDPDFVAELRDAVGEDDTAQKGLEIAQTLPDWGDDLEAALGAAPNPWDEQELQSWAELLPDNAALGLAISTCDVLIGVLFVVITISPAAAPLAVVVAADALLRLARVLSQRVDYQATK